jgi:hypothetical protein
MTKDESNRLAVKLVVALQCSLEIMDDLKHTSLYSQRVKFTINNLEKLLESHLRDPLNTLFEDNEMTFMAIQRGVHQLLNTPLEDLCLEEDEPKK